MKKIDHIEEIITKPIVCWLQSNNISKPIHYEKNTFIPAS